ncbi:hypothetical protein CUMW_211790 [Citrus unshiu]|uniref:Ubiquitin-like protease family profile domain-containing protein n=1 Tax=Citrus unshiu TaxID=55188 RepID=A0A2H5QBP5_CITUN|nr:hypothetical protein CUMW_211790 [Citrus unshiu]
MFTLANGQASDDHGVYTDVGNQNFSTSTSLYSFYGDVSGESVQVFTEFAGDMTVDRRVQHPRSFFEILLGLASMGWLGDEHIHEYFRLISEKQWQYKLKFKPLEVIFPRWLEYVGFYNIRPELRSADPWKVIVVKRAPQQELETGDCGVFVLMFTMYLMFGFKLEFNASHIEYFRKKIAVDIFNDDIVL